MTKSGSNVFNINGTIGLLSEPGLLVYFPIRRTHTGNSVDGADLLVRLLVDDGHHGNGHVDAHGVRDEHADTRQQVDHVTLRDVAATPHGDRRDALMGGGLDSRHPGRVLETFAGF